MPAIAFIGFGEAGRAFAENIPAATRAFDRKALDHRRSEIEAACRDLGVTATASNAEAVAGADLVLSLVTADQALAAARETAMTIAPGALFCDMNSVAPDTKRTAADAIERAGGRYVDVAVMAPAFPARRAVPMLLSGRHAQEARAALIAAGFEGAQLLDGAVGRASSVKMFRSVMIKGIEALTAECLLAAAASGVVDAVIASLDASWPGADWTRRADYNLERMMVHGRRRAEEMNEVANTLDTLGTGSASSRAAAARHQAIGALQLDPQGVLTEKLAAILRAGEDIAA